MSKSDLSNELGNVLPSSSKPRRIAGSGRIHVGTVGCSGYEDGHQILREALCDSLSMPWINGAVGEHNISDRSADVPSTIVVVGPVHGSLDS